jgi:hypothetical protein
VKLVFFPDSWYFNIGMLITFIYSRVIIKSMKKQFLCYTVFLVGFLFITGIGIAWPVQAVSLPDFSNTNDLPGLISSIYSFAITVVGIAVFIRILYAGFLMLTAAGNAAKWNDAKTKMTNAIAGAILLFAAYLILYIINPDLVSNAFKFTIPGSGQPSAPTAPSGRTSPTSGQAALSGVVAGGGVGFKNGRALSFSGLPVAQARGGIFSFTIKVTDRNGDVCRQVYSVEVIPSLTSFTPATAKYAKYSVPGRRSSFPLAVANAQEDEDAEILRRGGCVITTDVLPDAIEDAPYYAEIYVAGEKPFVYEIEEGVLPDGLNLTAASEMPVLTIENKTAQRTPSYVFYQTDRFRLEVTNAKPNSILYFKWVKNGQPWFYPGKTPDSEGWIEYGITDGEGKWVNEANFTPAEVGRWQEYVMVDGQISRVIGFEVIDPSTRITTGDDVTATFYGAGGFTPCQPEHYCENPVTGERSEILSDVEITKTGTSERCPGLREVFECRYPEEEPNDSCRQFEFELRSCRDQMDSVKREDGTIDTSKITYSPTGEPPADLQAGNLYTVDQYAGDIMLGGGSKLVLCRYSDQQKAVMCGMSWSGEFCLPNRTAGINQTWCAR